MSIITAIKITAMVSMFLLTTLTGSIPLRLKSFKENQKLLSLTSAFSGGLFLSVGIIHLLPEASHKFHDYHKESEHHKEHHKYVGDSENPEETTKSEEEQTKETHEQEEVEQGQKEEEEEEEEEQFPFSMLITVLSFSFVLMIEKVIGDSEHQHHHHNNDNNNQNSNKNYSDSHNHDHPNHDSHLKNQKIEDNYNIKVVEEGKQLEFNSNQNSPIISVSRNNSSNEVEKDYCHQDEINQNELENKSVISNLQQQDASPNTTMMGVLKLSNDTSNFFTDRAKVDSHLNNVKGGVEVLLNQVSEKEQQNQQINIQMKDLKEIHIHENNSLQEIEKEEEKPSQQKKSQIFRQISNILDKQEKETVFSLTPYIIQFAFGLHATLEGLAIGVQDQVSQCLTIALAVVAHKWAEGLVMGLAMKQANLTLKRATIMITIQGIMNPIGIGIGWILSEAGNLTSGILMSISAGTFLYIATNEVIVEEFSLSRFKKIKFFLYLIGIGFISSLWLVEQMTEE